MIKAHTPRGSENALGMSLKHETIFLSISKFGIIFLNSSLFVFPNYLRGTIPGSNKGDLMVFWPALIGTAFSVN